MSTGYLHGKFVWYEHLSSDVGRASTFYEALFGWHTENIPMGAEQYPMIHIGRQAIGGFRSAPSGQRSHWLPYLSVGDVDVLFRGAIAAGAKQLTVPTDIGEFGRGAVIADPTGAVLSLWKDAKADRADAEDTSAGDWFWTELWTPQERRALAFYETIFGFSHTSMDMGPMGTYYVLNKDGKPRAGLARAVDPKANAMWLPYVKVNDTDATAQKAAQLRGEVVTPPRDIPGIGRFAVIVDPTGAALAFITPQRG
jgi:uncharacterized protein